MHELVSITPQELDALSLGRSDGNWLQTSEMAALRRQLDQDVHLLGLKRDGIVIAGGILAGKKGAYEIIMGPLLDFADRDTTTLFLNLLVEKVKKLGGYAVSILPNVVYQLRGSDGASITSPNDQVLGLIHNAGWAHRGFTEDPINPRFMFVKDLSGLKTAEDLALSYRQTTRQIIRKFDPTHYEIRALKFDELKIMQKLINESNQKNHVPERSLSYLEKFYKAFGDKTKFMVVFHDGQPISGGIFVLHPREMVYFLSGTSTKYRPLNGAHYLQDHMMRQCLELGLTRYNFYGISGDFKHNPLLTFKAGFRGDVEEYVGEFYKVVSPARYHSLRLARKAKSVVRKLGLS